MAKRYMPKRWAFKHGAYYYRTRPDERELFDGKAWFRLGTNYPGALRAFADRRELAMGETFGAVLDRYQIEVLPLLRPNTQASYGQALERLRGALGHNPCRLITAHIMYQYLEARIKSGRTMNVANADLKVANVVLDRAVRWGVIPANVIKGAVSYFGARDGLKKERDRYVEDWELVEWQKVASPVQRAFAAVVMLTGARKTDALQILLQDDRKEGLRLLNRKTGKETIYRWTPALREAVDLARSIRSGDSMFLFTNRNGDCFVSESGRCEPFDQAWRRSMQRAIKTTALEEPFTRHDLRAKVGSDAESEHIAQQLLGHSDPAMTRRHYRRGVAVIDPAR